MRNQLTLGHFTNMFAELQNYLQNLKQIDNCIKMSLGTFDELLESDATVMPPTDTPGHLYIIIFGMGDIPQFWMDLQSGNEVSL